jgi:hypothetical protein
VATSGDIIRPYDRDALRSAFRSAEPFPFIAIDDFLEPGFASELADSYPTFESAERLGYEFSALNEQRKVQVTDPAKFPPPVRLLNERLASQAFLDDVSYITGIPRLLADEQLAGGGMHVTGPGGRLDVHVDFNFIRERELHRRLNILVYLNRTWRPEWGGQLELWDRDVKHRHHTFEPILNRCVIFETSDISFHGVRPLTCPPDVARCSFAAYYYTVDPPPHWKGVSHSTIFKARPDEILRGLVLMPANKLRWGLIERYRAAKRRAKGLLGL